MHYLIRDFERLVIIMIISIILLCLLKKSGAANLKEIWSGCREMIIFHSHADFCAFAIVFLVRLLHITEMVPKLWKW